MHIPVFGQEANLLDKEAGISCNASTIYTEYPMHTHNHYEFFIVTDGAALHLINDSVQKVHQGDFYFIRPADIHCYNFYHSENFEIRNLAFTEELFKDVSLFLNRPAQLREMLRSELPPHIVLEGDAFARTVALMNEIHDLLKDGQKKHARLHAQCATALFLENYFFRYDAAETPANMPDWLETLLEQMNRLENLQGGYHTMCRLAPCSPNHLCRTMKNLCGKTPTEYINEQRLNYSVFLLRQTDIEIMEVCQLCGFSNLSHFYHLFKKQFRKSPAQFRKQSRARKQNLSDKKEAL